jgi:hypothetical protein
MLPINDAGWNNNPKPVLRIAVPINAVSRWPRYKPILRIGFTAAFLRKAKS